MSRREAGDTHIYYFFKYPLACNYLLCSDCIVHFCKFVKLMALTCASDRITVLQAYGTEFLKRNTTVMYDNYRTCTDAVDSVSQGVRQCLLYCRVDSTTPVEVLWHGDRILLHINVSITRDSGTSRIWWNREIQHSWVQVQHYSVIIIF